MSKLKPCPFCGKKARIDPTESFFQKKTVYYPRCDTPKCVGNQGWVSFQTREEATQAWNRRADDE